MKTRIAQSGRNRPQEYGGPEPTTERVDDSISATGIDPLDVGKLVLRAVKENQLYIFTHQPYRAQVEARPAPSARRPPRASSQARVGSK